MPTKYIDIILRLYLLNGQLNGSVGEHVASSVFVFNW